MTDPRPLPQTVDDTRVSFSSLTRHRKCPQAWVYDSVRRLETETTGGSIRRDFGSWWHALRAADSIARGTLLGTLFYWPEELTTGENGPVLPVNDTLREHGASAVLYVAGDWWYRQSDTFRDEWVAEMGAPLPDHLEAMNARWRLAWSDDIAHEQPLGVEVPWSREVPRADGTTFTLDGQVDEVYLDTRHGLVVVRDHKTNNAIPAAESLDDLLDSQTHLYAWGVMATVNTWDLEEVRGVALSYDRARSAVPKPPAVTATGRLSKSTSDYDLATYLAFTSKPVPWGTPDTFVKSGPRKGEPKFGTYERDPEVVASLDTPAARAKWNDRTLTPVNVNIVRGHLLAARDTRGAMDVTLATFHERGDAPRNLTRMGCRFCDYAELCLAELRGGPKGLDPADYGLRPKA